MPTTAPCCLPLPAPAGEELRERGLGDDDATDSLVLTKGVLQDLAHPLHTYTPRPTVLPAADLGPGWWLV